MIDLIRKLSQQTEAALARAEIAEIETANLRTKYAGKQARAGPGGQKKLTKGTIVDWKFLEKMKMEEREKEEAVAARAKERPREHAQRKGRGLRPLGRREQCRKQKYTPRGPLMFDFYLLT